MKPIFRFQRSFLLVLLLVGIALSCRKTVEIPLPGPVIEGKPSVATLSALSVSNAGSKFQFSVDLYVINKSGRYVTGLQKGNFSIPGSASISIVLDNLSSTTQNSGSGGGYSAMLLLDQSGSILSTDPNRLRINASKIFLDFLGPNDFAGLSSFTSSYANRIRYHKEFSRDTLSMKRSLDSLASTVGGGTPLYLSAFDATNFTARAAKTTNRALVVFTDGENTDAGKTILEVIANAQQQKVPLFMVGLSSGVNVPVLAQMANETGGAFFYAKDAEQLVTAFGTLGNLLRGRAQLYRTTWTATRTSGTWAVGSSLSGTIKVSLPGGEIVDAPFWVKVQ